MKRYIMKAAQRGTAAAPAVCINKGEAGYAVRTGSENELNVLKQAVERLKTDLRSAAGKAGDESRLIFEAELMLLEDPNFTDGAYAMIMNDSATAVRAITETAQSISKMFLACDNDYLKERAEDINGLAADLISILNGNERAELSEPSIIVANEISPTYFSGLDHKMIRGIVTVKGSPVSHLSILAGNYGIPYIYGSQEAVSAIVNGCRLIIDDDALIIDPEDAEYLEALHRMENARQEDADAAETDVTCRTRICANAGCIEDIEAAIRSGADGVGLFRTELLFLDNESEPTEDEQYSIYSKAAELMAGKELVIRTMDIGSDKVALWLPMADEKNPALGCRGIRVSLNNRDIFKKQLRALMRASCSGNIRVLLPMIISVSEVENVRSLMAECAEELENEGIGYRIPELGVMIETPAAVIMASELAEKTDFFSIGTNDLTQYTLAIDREAEGLEDYYDPYHEAVFRMIEQVCNAAHEHEIKVTVCGELAGNEKAIERLISAGVDELSVSPFRLEKTRARAAQAEKGV